jgi:hypothetical protein
LDGKAQKAAIGLDLSGGGCCILTQENVAQKEFHLLCVIETRTVRLRAKTVWADNVTHQGRKVWRYGMQFTGIPADDWDAIIRYTTDKAVADSNKAAEDLTKVRLTPDDTARLLPLALQTRLLNMLVQRGRLATRDAARTILLLGYRQARRETDASIDDSIEGRQPRRPARSVRDAIRVR